jgi:hypothetical protein
MELAAHLGIIAASLSARCPVRRQGGRVGQELKTTMRMDGRILEGTALLETDSLIFRGDGASITVTFAEMHSVETSPGWLEIRCARGLLLFELGAKAEPWADRIKNPKALVDKLGVGEGKKVVVVGKLDEWIKADVAASGAKVAKSARGKDFDVAFLAVKKKADLDKIASTRELIHDTGGIWIVYPKGSEDPRERDVLIAGRTLGLVDNKQVKVDDALTAVRFVIPVALRKKKK